MDGWKEEEKEGERDRGVNMSGEGDGEKWGREKQRGRVKECEMGRERTILTSNIYNVQLPDA
jgi:hypothetical protein